MSRKHRALGEGSPLSAPVGASPPQGGRLGVADVHSNRLACVFGGRPENTIGHIAEEPHSYPRKEIEGNINMPHHAVSKSLRANARRMRKDMTDAELKLWNELRAKRLMDLAFRRQMPIDRYIADFACPDHKLIIEVDGSQHGERLAEDAARTARLAALGWTVLRVWNDDVIRDIDAVCTHILGTIGRHES